MDSGEFSDASGNGRELHFSRLKNLYLTAPVNNEIYHETTIIVEHGSCEIIWKAEPSFHHGGGFLHGSTIFRLLDDAAFFAAQSVVKDQMLVTVSFNMYFLRPVAGGDVFATGNLQSAGRNLILAEASIVDSHGKAIASGSGQFMRSGRMLTDLSGYTA